MSARLSSADAAWLHMDRPTNLMVINSLLLFDEPVDWDKVKQITQERLVDRYPRFRQRVVESRVPLRPPKWEADPDFALEHHMHHLALPAPGDDGALQDLIGDLMTTPLDRNRPLWHTYMIDGYGDGAALISRMHHCIADGIALARVMLSMTDSAPEAGIAPDIAKDFGTGSGRGLASLLRPAARVLSIARRGGSTAFRQAVSITASPAHAASLAGAIARDGGTLLRLALTPADRATALKGDPRVSRRVSWSKPLSLRQIKGIARAHDASVNDVLLAAVSGAVRHYLQECGSPVAEIQAMVPFNLRPLDEPVPRELGNKFGLVFLPLPVGMSGTYRRLVEVHRRMDELKRSRDGAVSYVLLGVAGLTPEPVERKIVDLFSAKGTAVMTNVPGPKRPVFLAGTRVRTVLFWAPTSGQIGMSVSIFSYAGKVTVGLMVDAALVPHPDRIVTQLERELLVMAKLETRGNGRARTRTSAHPRGTARHVDAARPRP
jgi:WS/DGAT/MGAT family acyltransferase